MGEVGGGFYFPQQSSGYIAYGSASHSTGIRSAFTCNGVYVTVIATQATGLNNPVGHRWDSEIPDDADNHEYYIHAVAARQE